MKTTVNVERDMTREVFTNTWVKHAIQNGKKPWFEDLTHIQNYLKAERAIICGSGPSLNWDFKRLLEVNKEGEGETLIIANHSNLATLCFEGIIPDLVVVTDSQELTKTRIERDVLPHFKHQLKKRHTKFILPTHANPDLVDLIGRNKFELYGFNQLTREDTGDQFAKLYNNTIVAATEGRIETMCLMVGSVSNAAVLVCNALKLLKKADGLEDVILSGVDYSYPADTTRCEQVTWNKELKDFEVIECPKFLGPEIRQVKYNGLLTSEDQVAYYKDLRFIYWNMIEAAKDEAPFRLSTSSHNFIADFLPIQAI